MAKLDDFSFETYINLQYYGTICPLIIKKLGRTIFHRYGRGEKHHHDLNGDLHNERGPSISGYSFLKDEYHIHGNEYQSKQEWEKAVEKLKNG